MFLMIDNIDSFVWNLIRYIRLCGDRVDVCRNDRLDFSAIEQAGYQGIVLSPGPGQPATAGRLPELIRHFAGRIPIFGVCLGHQAIAETFGSRTICAKTPMHGKMCAIHHDGLGVFAGIPSPLNVTRYHSLIVDRQSLPPDLVVSAETSDGTVMGLRDRTGLLEGVQFHPEAELTEHGMEMIANFVRFCRERSAIPESCL